MKKALKHILPLLLALLLLCGCGGRANKEAERTAVETSAKYASNGYAAEYGYDYEVAEEAEAPSPAVKGAPAGTEGGIPTGRKIIRNADLSIQTRTYDSFMADLNARITGNGGYIESSYTNGESYTSRTKVRSASLTVRIPAEKLDAFLDGVCSLGNVLYKNVYLNDVTASYVDTEARLSALRTERDTLMGLLAKAVRIEDTIAIYERISEVTYEIESYESRMRAFDDQIAYSTVTLNISEVERETVVIRETTGEEIARKLRENLQDIGEWFRNAFISVVSDLPMILIVAVIALILFILIRRAVRKKRKKSGAAEKNPSAAEEKPAAKKE